MEKQIELGAQTLSPVLDLPLGVLSFQVDVKSHQIMWWSVNCPSVTHGCGLESRSSDI